MSTPNLGIIHIAASQNQKEVTANTAFDDLDLAMTNNVNEFVPDNHIQLSLTDAQQNAVFIFNGTLTANRGVTLPAKKFYVVSNQTLGSPLSSLVFGTATSPSGRVATVPPGSTTDYVILYCDGVNVDIIASSGSGKAPEIFSEYIPAFGVGTNNQVLRFQKLDRAAIFPAGALGSFAVAKTVATLSTTYTIRRNGQNFATINFAAGSAVGIFTQASDAIFAIGDTLEVDGPAVADVTLATVGITLQGIRL